MPDTSNKGSAGVAIALLGAGGINQLVADAILNGDLPGVNVVAVAGSTAHSASADELAAKLGVRAVAADRLPESGADWVVEAAGGKAVREHVPALWRAGMNTMIMSIGAMVDPAVEQAWHRARLSGVQVILPSGGIAGLDGIRAMASGNGLANVTITNIKHPDGLRGAPYLVENSIVLPDDRAVTVFEGTAREAIAAFPANVNVSIALSLAGIGPDRTRVIVRSDPKATQTFHRIEADGSAGQLLVEVSSNPSPANPRTSVMAAASAIAELKEISGV